MGLSFAKLSFKVAPVYIHTSTQSSDMFTKSTDAKQKHLGVKKREANKKQLTYVQPKALISAEAK